MEEKWKKILKLLIFCMLFRFPFSSCFLLLFRCVCVCVLHRLLMELFPISNQLHKWRMISFCWVEKSNSLSKLSSCDSWECAQCNVTVSNTGVKSVVYPRIHLQWVKFNQLKIFVPLALSISQYWLVLPLCSRLDSMSWNFFAPFMQSRAHMIIAKRLNSSTHSLFTQFHLKVLCV